MTRIAILTAGDDPAEKRPMALTVVDKAILQLPYEKSPGQVWVPRFCIGVRTAGVAFINTAGPTVALRGTEIGKPVLAEPFHGDRTDDNILWTFAPGTVDASLRIIWAHDTTGALNAAGAIKKDNEVCVWHSDKPSENENWRLVFVEG